MATINTGSDLLETILTPQEKNTAMQFQNKELTIAYLQNTKVDLIRTLANQRFDKAVEDTDNQRQRAYTQGQLDLITALIDGAISPEPVPVDTSIVENSGNLFPSNSF